MRSACVAGLISASLAFGCADHRERAPATCLGDCGLSPGLGTGLPTDPEGEGGANGEGGSDAGTSKTVDLTGNVRILNDDLDIETSSLLTGEVDLKAEGENGRLVTAHWNGADPFALAGLPPSTAAWVLATPKSPAADDALPALDAVRTNVTDPAGVVTLSLYLVHTTSIDHVFELASVVPVTRDPAKGQLVVRFAAKSDTSGAALAGLTITAPSAENVLYGASNGFSDLATETDITGTIVLANVPSAPFPGALVTLQITGAKTTGVQVRAVTGAVTIARLAL
jgi:hypothetical protein